MPTLPDNPLSADQHRKLEKYYAKLASSSTNGLIVPLYRTIKKKNLMNYLLSIVVWLKNLNGWKRSDH